MSSLIFYTNAQQAFVVTDTLAVDPEGKPALFTTKAHYIPHLRMIVAGTGIGRFADDWFIRINSRMLVRDIEELDTHTPTALREIWDEFESERSQLEGKTTTVYHFGLSESTQEIVTFAYRSKNGFISEGLAHGVGAKPDCAMPQGDELDVQSMMEDQRRREAKRPRAKRIYIGGEAMAMHLTADGCKHYRLFRFPDYDKAAAKMRHG